MKDCGQNTRSLAVPVRAPMSGNTEEHKIAQRRRSSLVSYMRNKESNLVRRGRASEGTRIHFATRLQKLQISKPPHRTNQRRSPIFFCKMPRDLAGDSQVSLQHSCVLLYFSQPQHCNSHSAIAANLFTFHAHCIEVSGTVVAIVEDGCGWRFSYPLQSKWGLSKQNTCEIPLPALYWLPSPSLRFAQLDL